MAAKITTIIPTFNRAHRLKIAIETVLFQSYSDFEIHIYDNASIDNTQEIMESFCKLDSRIIYCPYSENVGVTKDFAFGVPKMTIPYSSFLSDDDFLLPNFYEDSINGLQKYPQAGFFCGDVIISSEIGKIIHVI